MFGSITAIRKLTECEEILLGKRQHYSANFLDKDTGDANIYEALRYIFEGFLHWSPIQVRDCLNKDIVQLMKMEPLINRVPCPPELDRTRDYEYVAWYLYPETVNCNSRDLAVKVYSRILSGEISRFPKGYFDCGFKGWFRARAAFRYMLTEFMPTFESIEAVYAYFSTPQAKDVLRKYKLTVPLRELYGSPLDYLHDSLCTAQKSEELYQKYNAIIESRKKHRQDNGGDYEKE